MLSKEDRNKKIKELARADGRYHPDAFHFICDGLEYVMKETRRISKYPDDRHIRGVALAQGMAKLALKRWGYMARLVLKRWGVTSTLDFGEIVYMMIDKKLMRAQPGDSIMDFENVYQFEDVFEKTLKPYSLFKDFFTAPLFEWAISCMP